MSEKNNKPSALTYLNWFIAAVSILGWIESNSIIKLRGFIDTWISAYSRIIALITETLFGWIDFLWFDVTPNEMSVMILFTVFAVAYKLARKRAPKESDENNFLDKIWDDLWRSKIVYPLAMIVNLLLWEEGINLFFLLAQMLVIYGWALVPNKFLPFFRYEENFKRALRLDIMGISGFVLVTIAISYSLSS